jgi:hypothetical protein
LIENKLFLKKKEITMRTAKTILDSFKIGFLAVPDDVYTLIFTAGTISDSLKINVKNNRVGENITFSIPNNKIAWGWLRNLADIRPVYNSINDGDDDIEVMPFCVSPAYTHRFGQPTKFTKSITPK